MKPRTLNPDWDKHRPKAKKVSFDPAGYQLPKPSKTWYYFTKVKRTIIGRNKLGRTIHGVLDETKLPWPVDLLRVATLKFLNKEETMPKRKRLKKVISYVIAVIRQIFWPYDVFKRDDDGKIVYENKNGKDIPISDTFGSVIAKVLSLIVAVIGSAEILGIPIAEWIYMLLSSGS